VWRRQAGGKRRKGWQAGRKAAIRVNGADDAAEVRPDKIVNNAVSARAGHHTRRGRIRDDAGTISDQAADDAISASADHRTRRGRIRDGAGAISTKPPMVLLRRCW